MVSASSRNNGNERRGPDYAAWSGLEVLVETGREGILRSLWQRPTTGLALLASIVGLVFLGWQSLSAGDELTNRGLAVALAAEFLLFVVACLALWLGSSLERKEQRHEAIDASSSAESVGADDKPP